MPSGTEPSTIRQMNRRHSMPQIAPPPHMPLAACSVMVVEGNETKIKGPEGRGIRAVSDPVQPAHSKDPHPTSDAVHGRVHARSRQPPPQAGPALPPTQSSASGRPSGLHRWQPGNPPKTCPYPCATRPQSPDTPSMLGEISTSISADGPTAGQVTVKAARWHRHRARSSRGSYSGGESTGAVAVAVNLITPAKSPVPCARGKRCRHPRGLPRVHAPHVDIIRDGLGYHAAHEVFAMSGG